MQQEIFKLTNERKKKGTTMQRPSKYARSSRVSLE